MYFQRPVWEDELFEWDHLLEDAHHRKGFCNVQTTVTRPADILVNGYCVSFLQLVHL